MSKTTVVLKLARLTVPQKIEKARFIVQSMASNANFPKPVPDLATITQNVDDLEKAQLIAKGGGKDNTAAVKPKVEILNQNLSYLSSHVESIANGIGNGQADQIALSSGMDIRGPVSRSATAFNVTNTLIPGQVKLVAPFSDRSVFNFQMTLTPADESTYQTIGMTTRSKMTMDGLKSGQRYYFRVATVGMNGHEPWSKPFDLIVT